MADENYFKPKVEAALQSIARARTVFVISNIAALIVVAANFNLYFSWLRHLIEREPALGYADVHKAVAVSRVADTTIISVPLIGLKFFAGDISILAAAAMLVLAVWLYYALRREQHTVGAITMEVLDPPRSVSLEGCHVTPQNKMRASYLLYCLSSAFLFTTTSSGRRAIGDPRARQKKRKDARWTRWMTHGLIWAPCWTILLSFALDLWSLGHPSVLLPGEDFGDMKDIIFKQRDQRIEIYVRIAFIVCTMGVIGWLCARASYYWGWTGRVYETLYRAVEKAETQPTA